MNTPAIFFFFGSVLVVLSCQSSSEKSNELDSLDTPSAQSEPETREVRKFKATGNEPFWGLWINSDSIQFKSLYKDYGMFNFPYSEPEEQGDDINLYQSSSSAATISVRIKRDTCVDSMSGRRNPYTVTVDFDHSGDGESVTFEGCGAFEGDVVQEESY